MPLWKPLVMYDALKRIEVRKIEDRLEIAGNLDELYKLSYPFLKLLFIYIDDIDDYKEVSYNEGYDDGFNVGYYDGISEDVDMTTKEEAREQGRREGILHVKQQVTLIQ